MDATSVRTYGGGIIAVAITIITCISTWWASVDSA